MVSSSHLWGERETRQRWGGARHQPFLFSDTDIFASPCYFQCTSPSGNRRRLLKIVHGLLSRWTVCPFRTGKIKNQGMICHSLFLLGKHMCLGGAMRLKCPVLLTCCVKDNCPGESLKFSMNFVWDQKTSICFVRSLNLRGLFVMQHNLPSYLIHPLPISPILLEAPWCSHLPLQIFRLRLLMLLANKDPR